LTESSEEIKTYLACRNCNIKGKSSALEQAAYFSELTFILLNN